MYDKSVFNRVVCAAFFALCVFLLAASCSRSSSRERAIEIGERMFVGQVNNIYLNAERYMGRTIKLEGVFNREQWEGQTHYFVIRTGPGCCGDDGKVGFEVRWTEDQRPYPAHDSWVEAVGTLQAYRSGSASLLYLDLSSLSVLNRRGREFVN